MKAQLQAICFAILTLMSMPVLAGEGTASQLFGDLQQLVYQIRVIDLASGDKSSLGSGFQISADGLLATNFHVVSSYVHDPDKYRLEAIKHDGQVADVELLSIDVIHDLAIVSLATSEKRFFTFTAQPLAKGDRIYSMGNPHDLGMTIIEGNYNGLIKTSRYQKILFSGSLNPGMSGGPAIDEHGEIIGVNVATGGEQISFLVPVSKLESLLHKVNAHGRDVDFKQVIEQALLADQDQFYTPLLNKEWESRDFGELRLPGEISKSLKCWGHTLDDEDILYAGVHQHCYSQDEIYVSQNMYTGTFFYAYEWMSSEQLNRFQFYHLLEERYSHAGQSNISKKEDATNYECTSGFVSIDKRSWRISSCLRAYKKYRGIYDTLFLLASVDKNNKGVIIKTGATGISQNNAVLLGRKMMESVQWTP